jgi:hypothetical protein
VDMENKPPLTDPGTLVSNVTYYPRPYAKLSDSLMMRTNSQYVERDVIILLCLFIIYLRTLSVSQIKGASNV